MRHSIRSLRHSSWSPFLVPLALPLVLLVPGVGGGADEAQDAREGQEVILEETVPPTTETLDLYFPSTGLQFESQDDEAADERHS